MAMNELPFVVYSDVLKELDLSIHPSDWGPRGFNDYLQSLSKHLLKLGTQKYMLNPSKCLEEAKEGEVKAHFREIDLLTKEHQDDKGFVRLFLDITLEEGFFDHGPFYDGKRQAQVFVSDEGAWASLVLK